MTIKAANLTGTKTNYGFLDRLSQAEALKLMPLIAEIKAYTPKNGDLLKGRTLETIAELYTNHGAACLSVVTGRWFKGSLEFLPRIKAVTTLPLLRKDFIVTRSSLERSKELGASAVLLTKQLLDTSTLKNLIDYALLLGLTPFVEVASAEELAEFNVDQEAIIAVCNRDITTQETDDGDIGKSLALLNLARASGAGLVVSASAIEDGEQAKQLINAGYDALLVGTALLSADNLTNKLAEFSNALISE